MAVTKEIVIKGDSSDAQQSLEDLNKVIQEQIDITIEFEKELEKLEQQLKDTPKGNLADQKRLKGRIEGLKDALGDQKVALKSLNNERGKASKVLKTNFEDVTKNGGAIALLDTVTGGMASRTRDAFEATKLFNFSLKGTRTALIATGIGAFVVALGLVVAFWDEIVEFITGANKAMREQIALGQKQSEQLEFQLEILELQKTVLENQGKSTKEIEETIGKTLEDQLLQLETTLLQQKEYDKTLATKEAELSIWNKIQFAAGGQLGLVTLISEEEKTAREEREKGIQDTEKAIANIRVKQSEADKEKREAAQELADIEQAAIDKRQEEINKELEGFKALGELQKKQEQERIEKELETEQERLDALLQLEKDHVQRLQDFLAETEEQKIQLELERGLAELERLNATEEQKFAIIAFFAQKSADAQKKADDEVSTNKQLKDAQDAADKATLREQEQAALVATVTIANNLLSGAAKKNKGIAIAQALINTFLGISAGVKLGYPAAIPAVIAAAAVGFKAVSDIVKTKDEETGGGGNTFTGVGAFTPQAPSFNLVEGSGTNQIAESISQQAPIEAFVVSGNVTTSQSLDRNIVEDSSF